MSRILVAHNNDNEGCLISDQVTWVTKHPLDLYAINRKLKPFGNFAVASINGEEHVEDFRLPVDVDKIPLGAVKLTDKEMEDYWHDRD